MKQTSAQYQLSGKILDATTNNYLSNAIVQITDLQIATSTNTVGNFTMNNLKKGYYLIQISNQGYENYLLPIDIISDTNISINLFVMHKELNEVMVTAVTRGTEMKRSPIIITTISKENLNQQGANNVIDALKNVAGINQITTGASISKPIIRGLGYNRVITLTDGFRQEGQQWGDEHGIEIDDQTVDRVEIIKGPGSLLYGSDGMAGVINFIGAKIPLQGKINTSISSNYQSNNNLIANSISNAGNKNGLHWMGRLSQKIAGNYQNKWDGKVLNTGFSEWNANARIGVSKNWGFVNVSASSYNSTIGLPEGERDSQGKFVFLNANGIVVTASDKELNSYNIGFPYQKINHQKIVLHSYFKLNKGSVNADIGWQNNVRKEIGDIAAPHDVALLFDLQTFIFNTRYNTVKYNGWESCIGTSGMLQSNINKGVEALIPNYQLFDIGAFATTQKTFLDKLILAAGLRLDNRTLSTQKLIEPNSNKVKFEQIHQHFNGVSGSIGMSYLAGKSSTFKFNFSNGYRAPNIPEIASNGRHEGSFRYEIGNTNLKSENSNQLDIAYYLNNKHITLECTPFINFINNYIYTQKLQNNIGEDSIVDPNNPVPAFTFTQGNAMLIGTELLLDVHPHPLDWLHIQNSFSIVKATLFKQTSDKTYLPFIPAPRYRLDVKAHASQWHKYLHHAYVKMGIDYYFAQNNIYSAFNTETKTPAYSLFNFGLGSNIKINQQLNCMSVFISADNVLNVAYQSHLSRLKYAPQNIASSRNGVFNMGRNVSIRVLFNF
jgi:iron complex outermembrane recepter protein